MIRQNKSPICGTHHISGIILLSTLRVELSKLNEHMFRHNFNFLSSVCSCCTANKDTAYFFPYCSNFDEAQRYILCSLLDNGGLDTSELDAQVSCNPILYKSSNPILMPNRMIIEGMIKYIKATNRFNWSTPKVWWRRFLPPSAVDLYSLHSLG